jgi:O-antigen/teichoic acid export membrane protein
MDGAVVDSRVRRRRTYPEAWTRPYFSEDEGDLAGRAARSSFWMLTGIYVQRFLQLFVTAVLARILMPEDFGLVAMSQIVVGLVRIFGNYGLGAAIIYRQDASEIHLSTAFWFNLGVSMLLFGVAVALSPLAALYFDHPAVAPVLAVASAAFVLEGLGSVSSTILYKQLRFRASAAADFVAAVASFVVALASVVVFDLGYWGLVLGGLAGSFTGSLLRLILGRWLPRRLFDRDAMKEMFRYGRNFFAHGVLNYLSAHLDRFIIGRRLGAASMGFYLFAYEAPHLIHLEFSRRLMGVLFPVLCRVSDDRERFRRGYLTALRFIATATFPACFGLAVVSEHFILAIYGDRWVDAILPMQILCFAALSRSVLTTMGSIYNSLGRPEIEVKWNLINFPIVAAAVWVGSAWGLLGVALAVTVSSYLSFIAMWMAMRLAGIPFATYLRALAPALCGSIAMAAVVRSADLWILSGLELSPFATLPMLIMLGLAAYMLFGFLFFRSTLLAMLEFARRGAGSA